MASIEEGLKQFVETVCPAAGKGYPEQVPQDAALPSFAYQTTSDDATLAHDRSVQQRKASIAVMFICATYAASKAAANTLKGFLDGYRGYMGSALVDFCKTTSSDDWAEIHQLPVARLDVTIRYRL